MAEPLLAEDEAAGADRCCAFFPPSGAQNGRGHAPDAVDLTSLLEEAVLQLRKDVPLELVVNMFQKLVRDRAPHRPSRAHRDPRAAESPAHPVLGGRQAHGHGHEDGHRVAAHGAVRARGRAVGEAHLALWVCRRGPGVGVPGVGSEYVQIVVEGLAQCPDLEACAGPCEVPATEVGLPKREVDERAAPAQNPGTSAVDLSSLHAR